ncbi:MAG: PAS domain-containing protein [Byssovorax sp.]
MSENINANELLQILNRLPSVPWSSRIDPVAMTSEWVYVSPRMAELYGLTDDEIHGGTHALMKRLQPEDAARLQQMTAVSLQTLAPIIWTGRVLLASGEVRWIETQIVLEREADGKIRSYGQAFDVTEQKRMEELHRAVIDAMPTGIAAMTLDGKLPIYNRAAVRFAGRPQENQSDLIQAFGVFKTDGVTPLPQEELPMIRALAGEEAPEAEMIMRNGDLEQDCWVHALGTPLRDAAGQIVAAMVIFSDVTAQRALEQELRATNAQLEENEQGKTVMIDQLRDTIEELSNPILEVWDDVLVMPIIGIVDSRRTVDMVRRLLVEVARTQASFVIVDLTGVEVVDTRTADHLIKLIRKVELIGARCVLTGIRQGVSETLVDLGLDFGRITTLRNLKHGLREALRHARREREGLRDHSLGDKASEVRG